MLKDFIQNIVWENYYINQFFYKFAPLGERRKQATYISEMCDWDTIDDITALKEYRDSVEKGREFRSPSPIWGNTHIYGIWYSLFYNIVRDHIQYSPAIEHGLIFYNQIFMDLLSSSRSTYATFSPFRKDIIHNYRKEPVFCVGPYIHYADPFYDNVKFQKMKEKLGRVLLVFPIHSTDQSEANYEEEDFIRQIKKIEKKYDTVLVNAFWWNVNDRIINRLAAEGYHISSAGFRDDIMFLSRLKTIIRLSDYAVGNSIGTHVGYCLHENVPFMLLKTEAPKEVMLDKKENKLTNTRITHMNKLKQAFSKETPFITEEQRTLVNYYWGNDCIRTPNELKQMCRITRDLHNMTRGNTFLNSIFIKKIMREYQSEDEKLYAMLVHALT